MASGGSTVSDQEGAISIRLSFSFVEKIFMFACFSHRNNSTYEGK